MLFLKSGFKINYINSFNDPITDEEVKKIIETCIQEDKKIKEEEKQTVVKKEEEQKKIYSDPRLQIDKKVIEWTFTKIEKVVALAKGFIS